MTCEHCKDTDGVPMFPTYGLAPHHHLNNITFGSTIFTGDKVEGFTPDNDDPRMGIWWCVYCGDGNPCQSIIRKSTN
jgi:hypothetical protein